MEEWKNGMMEYWNIGILGNTGSPDSHRDGDLEMNTKIPSFQHSIIPQSHMENEFSGRPGCS